MYFFLCTDKYLSDMIKRDIFDSYTNVVDSLFSKCNKSEKNGKIPIRVSYYYFFLITIYLIFSCLLQKNVEPFLMLV